MSTNNTTPANTTPINASTNTTPITAPVNKTRNSKQLTIEETCENLYKNYMIDGYMSIELEAILNGDMTLLMHFTKYLSTKPLPTKPKPKWLSVTPQRQDDIITQDITNLINLENNENSTTQLANYNVDPMFSIPFEDEADNNTTAQVNNEALKSGHNELNSAIVTTTPIVPTAIIAAVNDDQIDHILGDNGQMATPMHIIANDLNSNICTTTLEQDLDRISTTSDTNAMITPTKTKQPRKRILLDFMYPREMQYPTDLFWTDPLIPTLPVVPPRPVKNQTTTNNNTPPALPPRPIRTTSAQVINSDSSQLPSQQDVDSVTPNIPEGPCQDQFINNIVSTIIAKSIAEATSNTLILEKTRGTVAKTQYQKNPNIRDDSNNVVKPNYKNRYIIMPYELDNMLPFEDFLLSITDLELLAPYSKKQVYNKDATIS